MVTISLATLPNFPVTVSRTPMADSAHLHQGFVSRIEPEDLILIPHSLFNYSPLSMIFSPFLRIVPP